MKQRQQHFDFQFEQTTFCYMEQLFRLAYARIGNLQDAEDIVQETYLKAWRAFGNLRQHQRVKGWLTQILINTVRDYQRKGMRVVPTVDLADVVEGSINEPSQVSAEEEICRDEIDPQISRALRSIPESFLTPLLLREIDGCTYEEIAHTLDIPVGTVMSRLFRARSMLRKALLPELLNTARHIPPSDACDEEKRKRGLPQ